jgi:hypothetical protein
MIPLLFPLLWLLIIPLPASGSALVPNDFAAGLPLPTTEAGAMYRLPLPLAVYERVVSQDLADLRVFNSSGEVVPHALRRVPQPAEERTQTVPFFPLPEAVHPSNSDLSLRVSRNADGAVVTVDASTIASPQPITTSYLLDLTRIDPKPQTLELRWRGQNPAGLFTVAVHQSSDLNHWSPLVPRAVLADLQYQGSTVTARRMSLPVRPLAYLRLTCGDCRQSLHLEEVRALANAPTPVDQWQWLRLTAGEMREERGERCIDYRLAAKVRITAVQLDFAEPNSVLRALVDARSSADAPWRPVAQADFYRLEQQGNALTNPPVACAATLGTQWRIRVLADGAGLSGGSPPPRLALGWQPDELLFLGRGQGPYTLAFGSSKAAAQPPIDGTLVLAALREAGMETQMRQITPGPVQLLAGDQALKPRLAADFWKTLLLWLVLVAGVAVLALMVRTLVREMVRNRSA